MRLDALPERYDDKYEVTIEGPSWVGDGSDISVDLESEDLAVRFMCWCILHGAAEA